MGTFSSNSSRDARERSKEPHPIWRGIGFMMMVIGPIVSFALADTVMQFARSRNIIVPPELSTAPVDIPLYGPVPDLYAVLILTGVFTMVLFGIFAVINALMYRASAGNTYQVFESEPKQYKKKKKLYKR